MGGGLRPPMNLLPAMLGGAARSRGKPSPQSRFSKIIDMDVLLGFPKAEAAWPSQHAFACCTHLLPAFPASRMGRPASVGKKQKVKKTKKKKKKKKKKNPNKKKKKKKKK